MKKHTVILYTVTAVAAVGLVAYLSLSGNIDTDHLPRYGIIIGGILLGLLRSVLSAKKQTAERHALYSHNYDEFIGKAFLGDKALSRRFYSALDDYNDERPASALKKLQSIRPNVFFTEDVYAVTAFEALCLDDMQAWDKAIEKYAEAVQIRPSSILYSNMGHCYRHMGRTDKAADCYRQAVQADPSNPLPHINLAFQCIRLGEHTQGKQHAQAAIDIQPQHPKALKAMAICCYMLGDEEAYRSFYRRAIANGVAPEELSPYFINELAAQLEAERDDEE